MSDPMFFIQHVWIYFDDTIEKRLQVASLMLIEDIFLQDGKK